MSILPLLTLQMTAMGLTLADVAQVYLFMPVSSVVAPLAIGEKYRHLVISTDTSECLKQVHGNID